jgi:hypothetical protein
MIGWKMMREWKRMLVIAPVVMRQVVGNNRMYLGKRG